MNKKNGLRSLDSLFISFTHTLQLMFAQSDDPIRFSKRLALAPISRSYSKLCRSRKPSFHS
jgi:hypothetical protein